jgi:hypothetical protein
MNKNLFKILVALVVGFEALAVSTSTSVYAEGELSITVGVTPDID